MNFVIKSVLYWIIFLVFISAVSTYLFPHDTGLNIALTQFEKTAEAQAKLQQIAHKNNVYSLCIGALWCLAIGIYVNMAINATKNKEQESE